MSRAKLLVALLMVVVLSLACLAGCTNLITGSGSLNTEEFNFSGFTHIDAGYSFDIEIVPSNFFSVSITADDNLFEYLQVTREGNILKIGLRPGYAYYATHRVRITMPVLNELSLSGGSMATINGFRSSEDFKLNLFGGSRVIGEITAGNAEFNLSGGTWVALYGSASDLIIRAVAGSQLSLGGFSVSNADVTLGGGSQATINLDGTLNADLSEGSELFYIGEPSRGDIITSDDSTLSKKSE